MRQMNTLTAVAVILAAFMAPKLAADTVLITGANRGIGLEFARQYAALGWRVVATHRSEDQPASLVALQRRYPETVVVERLDVTDHAMIDALASRYRGQPVDVLINNAGLVGALEHVQDQMFGSLDYELLALFMLTNVAGPLKVSEAFFDNVRISEQKRIVAISSLAGSFQAAATNRPGRVHYKTSKAALNMAVTCIATATGDADIIAVAIHPGGVKVEKLAAFDLPGFIEPAESIASMIRVIDSLEPADSGTFLNYTGEPLPW